MCFSVRALYPTPISLCSSKQLWGKIPRNPDTLKLRISTGGNPVTFLAPVSIDTDICFKHRIQNGRDGGEPSHGIALFLLLELLPTVRGRSCGFLGKPAHPQKQVWSQPEAAPSPSLWDALDIHSPFEKHELVQLHAFLKVRDFWVFSQHSLLNRLLGSWKDGSKVRALSAFVDVLRSTSGGSPSPIIETRDPSGIRGYLHSCVFSHPIRHTYTQLKL